jgi:MoxR-like ATPase
LLKFFLSKADPFPKGCFLEGDESKQREFVSGMVSDKPTGRKRKKTGAINRLDFDPLSELANDEAVIEHEATVSETETTVVAAPVSTAHALMAEMQAITGTPKSGGSVGSTEFVLPSQTKISDEPVRVKVAVPTAETYTKSLVAIHGYQVPEVEEEAQAGELDQEIANQLAAWGSFGATPSSSSDDDSDLLAWESKQHRSSKRQTDTGSDVVSAEEADFLYDETLEDYEEEIEGLFDHSLISSDRFIVSRGLKASASESRGVMNKQFTTSYKVQKPGFTNIGTPEQLALKLADVGYQCLPFLAAQMALVANTPHDSIRTILLEGPSGCGKSYMAKCLAKITGAELMVLTCYSGMELKNLIESPSTLALANAMAGRSDGQSVSDIMNLGILSRAFLASQERPVILLIDELDKVDVAIDTFFLGPIQDARIWLESRPPIDANIDNLLILFTKNMERRLNDALLRRLHPIMMTYLNATLERKILSEHCWPQLVDNLVAIADTMRYSDASYRFERPPAPEELLKVARYVMQLLEWDIVDYSFVGRNVWYMMAKSESDRFVLELMLRYHPDYYDSLNPNGRLLTLPEVHAKLGREILKGIVEDPNETRRKPVYKVDQIRLTNIGTPKELVGKLAEVKYECMEFLAMQICLILNTPSERVRAILLEGPSGCGKSYMAKSLAKITGAEYMCLSCYSGMNSAHLIETPSMMGIANAMSGKEASAKDEMVNLGILSRAFLKSQNQPVIMLIDEIDKVEVGIDTFFLGPIQDGTIYPESRPPIDCNTENLLLIFTKNFVRNLNDALLRRLHPVQMTYLNSELERRILKDHCSPTLVDNIIGVVDRMRYSGGTYGFDRPPAPEELLTIGRYINKMIEYDATDFGLVGRNVFSIISKSDHDRAVLEHMMRYHPDFLDPLVVDGKAMTKDEVYAKLGRTLLKGIVADPNARKREQAWEDMEYNY